MPSAATGERAEMTAHHFFVEPDAIADGVVTITGDDAHHAARVLRVRTGESITVADDSGRVVDAVVTDAGDIVFADVVKETMHEEPRPRIVLCQALSKGDKLDDVVQKATEIGVVRVVPFIAERSIVVWDDAKRAKNRERWTSVAFASAKQCKAPRLTRVDEIGDGIDAVLRAPAPVLVLHEADTAAPLRHVLPDQAPDALTLVVGPEGGFAPEEIERASAEGAEIVRLGPRVLRTQTAGPVAAAIVSYVYGAM